ncbi:hypothetical protein VP395_15735 [Mariniflexile soesokkakense]|uniref:Membrane protein DUF2207 n=1 Tax=Mariniflexile soesokkakense TaxID=1343160 RepID=A0ABV0ADN3_9FLAO
MEVTKKDIEKLIRLRKEDTFLNHLWNVFSRDFRQKGEIGRNEIKVWRQNMWNTTFYPVFTFELNANNHLVNITSKLNPIGKSLIGIFIVGFLYAIFPKNPLEFDLFESWPIIAVIGAFTIIFTLFWRMIYRFERQNQLDEMFEFLDIEVEKQKPEKEWSFKRTLIRLFTYPFCIFLIGLTFFMAIPNGQYALAIGTLGFVGFYLVTDLKMIFRKKTTGNNV